MPGPVYVLKPLKFMFGISSYKIFQLGLLDCIVQQTIKELKRV